MDIITSKTIRDYNDYIEHLKTSSKDHEEFLKKLYAYVKDISDIFYDGKHFTYPYACIITPLMYEEGKINDKIVDTSIHFVYEDKFKMAKDFDNFLDYLAYEARDYLIYRLYGYRYGIKYDDIYLPDRSKLIVDHIKRICQNNNIKIELLTLIPGFDRNTHLFGRNEMEYHYSFIVKYNSNEYLLDTTFAEYFYTKYNLLDRIGIMNQRTCDPAVFMLMSDKGKSMAFELINKGYIKLDDEKKKIYLDAFAVSARNGLYYESTNDFSFKTNYTLDDYDKMLNGEVSQVVLEGIENLGYQIRPLKDAKMMIKKK